MLIKIYKLLKSKKLAYILISCLMGYSLIGVLLPIILRTEYNYSFFSSPVLPILTGLFFINTLICTIEQGRKAYCFPKLIKKGSDIERLPYSTTINQKLDQKIIIKKLKAKGFRTLSIDNRIFAHKGRYSLWGAFIFHLSFLILIIAVIISVLTSFEGKMYINEGETLVDQIDSYNDLKITPYFNNSFFGFSVRLNKFSVDYPQDYYPNNLSSDISIIKDGQEVDRRLLKVMPPYRYGPYSLIQGKFGYSPHLIISKRGDNLVDAYATLNSIVTFENEKYIDEFDMDNLKFRIEFLPDGKEVNGNRIHYKPTAPAYKLIIYEGIDLIYNGILPQNEKLGFKDYSIIIPDYIYWSEIQVVKDYGVNPLYFSFLLGTIGICMFYFGNYQFIWITEINNESNGAGYKIGAGIKRRDPFFEEKFNSLVDYLNN